MSFQSINPATGELLKTFPLQTDAEVFSALEKADTLYRDDWRLRSVAERAAIVGKAAKILREKRDEYVTYPTLEMGKVTRFGYMEIDLVADILDYYATNGERLLAAQAIPGEPGATLLSEPIGVILAIEPWNFPYYQLVRVAAPQLIAGNVVMLKHAENVPQCALAFARLFEEAGAPEGAYTNLFCSIDQIASLIDDFRVRGVALTGSERAGTSVGERAGRNLKKVILELGGSDPAIIMPGAPLDHAVEQVVMGRTWNSGQGCVNIKRVIVIGRERGERMLEALKEKFAAINVGDPEDASTLLGPLVSERALQGLLKQIEEAKAAGANIVFGGNRVDRPGFYLEPTIITDITEANPLYTQEAFGPVLSFYVVDSEEEAIRLANATPYGLGGYVFDADTKNAQRIASHIDSGMVYINSCFADSPGLPFGGVKNSGFGRELSEIGMGEFLNRKLIRVTEIE
ncbi:TPA: NAD-dependent succinate-semialdehyde dehydrogenase [Citrobacter koseri]|uniref:NAD-dependent succinate-semialdehyde dehydrogenase n=1 Tax=Citrobacter TaxID=544 RepID=UPI000665C7BF|nr:MULTISPECIES: NAD-dependent succinate-semialdehyde dehydrogenase [Citrobacter]EKW5653508.1 NAD-dependent succinate-semialdehyde dehydrogenase [Citrobacter koseri]EKY0737387.1 NAD-dependent succinate-semialdehyde dehydrogenase [Citrobacter koseri]MBJ8874067.1 NAD-dependent succinate-semialdehyde dehydrogenase [Citrobacter koseri]MBJ9119465.1 NAD-dependent succinate-semialdehyde dehydrogenase [Citrobacter koseri]MBJ9236064.1 NAD-dependent succinate-semialdehyde dehydrogenase [Citrobacter kose